MGISVLGGALTTGEIVLPDCPPTFPSGTSLSCMCLRMRAYARPLACVAVRACEGAGAWLCSSVSSARVGLCRWGGRPAAFHSAFHFLQGDGLLHPLHRALGRLLLVCAARPDPHGLWAGGRDGRHSRGVPSYQRLYQESGTAVDHRSRCLGPPMVQARSTALPRVERLQSSGDAASRHSALDGF